MPPWAGSSPGTRASSSARPRCSTRASGLTNGDVCPKGTPDAGKPGVVIVESWPNFNSKGKGTETSGAPQDLQFANGQLITMAFVPATAAVPEAPGAGHHRPDQGGQLGRHHHRRPPRPTTLDARRPPPTTTATADRTTATTAPTEQVRAVVLVGGRGHPPAAAHLTTPEADAADRRASR